MIYKSARLFKQDKNYDQWERALWFADRIGVGVILYSDPRLVSTWVCELDAKKRVRDPKHSKNYVAWFNRHNGDDRYASG